MLGYIYSLCRLNLQLHSVLFVSAIVRVDINTEIHGSMHWRLSIEKLM